MKAELIYLKDAPASPVLTANNPFALLRVARGVRNCGGIRVTDGEEAGACYHFGKLLAPAAEGAPAYVFREDGSRIPLRPQDQAVSLFDPRLVAGA